MRTHTLLFVIGAAFSANIFACDTDIKNKLDSVKTPQVRASVENMLYSQLLASTGLTHDSLVSMLYAQIPEYDRVVEQGKQGLIAIGNNSDWRSVNQNDGSLSSQYAKAIQVGADSKVIAEAWIEVAKCHANSLN